MIKNQNKLNPCPLEQFVIFKLFFSRVVQLAGHQTLILRIGGSIPSPAANFINRDNGIISRQREALVENQIRLIAGRLNKFVRQSLIAFNFRIRRYKDGRFN